VRGDGGGVVSVLKLLAPRNECGVTVDEAMTAPPPLALAGQGDFGFLILLE